jgi:NAD(P)-dependent dehydrogenase (short-subunit alcohol dehydrogenase family)
LTRCGANCRTPRSPRIAAASPGFDPGTKTTGDGLPVEFASVVDAVRCAVELQREMALHNDGVPKERRIRFRIGINLGDIIIDVHDIYGDGINVAARLEALAEPGRICVSRVVRDLSEASTRNEAEWTGLIAKTVATYGRLDILVNNAGISGSSVGDPDGLEGWHRIIAVNQTSVFLGTRLAAEQMAKISGGSIVNISSIMGFVGSASGHPAYHASKGAVRIYSKAAAVRYGPSGVRVNTVHPGYMPRMLNATNAGERADKIVLTPLPHGQCPWAEGPRVGQPIEVAYGVLFLASDEASFVTGAELVIDGGYIAQ